MKTTIQVSTETKDKLDKFGRKGETYDQIVQRILARALHKRGGKTNDPEVL